MNWPILPLSAWEQTGTIFRSASCAHRISLRHISREKYESAPLSVTMARKHLQFLAPSSIAAMSRLSMRTSSQTVKPISLKLLKRSSRPDRLERQTDELDHLPARERRVVLALHQLSLLKFEGVRRLYV